jgi:uncharacterized protein (TIGR02452 family)
MGKYKSIASENEAIIDAGHYTAPNGARVDLSGLVAAARQDTRSYTPNQTADILRQEAAGDSGARRSTAFEVTGETSTQAGQRLARDEHAPRPAILTFASARNPGGGYLGGARSQEEDLCRSSALYTALREAPDFYAAHRADRDTHYSHRVIYSPDVPVYRDDRLRLLDVPYVISFLTSPAPNAGALRRNQPRDVGDLAGLITERAARVLAVAAHHGVRTLVLGAWGCGVFRNDPADVASAFRTQLLDGGVFEGRFERVVFAVLDPSASRQTLGVFQSAFEQSVDSGVARTTDR